MSGVTLIENYKNKKGRNEYAIILFRNKRSQMYTDAGGFKQANKTINESASEELKEESCNTFRISSRLLTTSVMVRQYKGFLVYIEGPINNNQHPIYSKYYKFNQNLLTNNKLTPYSFKETDDLTRFYISDLFKNGILTARGNFICRDANGKTRSIDGRAKAIIREAISKQIINISANKININLPKIKLKLHKKYVSPNRTFLNNTITYYT